MHSRSLLAVLAALLLAGGTVHGQAPGRGTVPVAARDLPRGVALTAADIVAAPRPAAVDSSARTARPGWTTRRMIAAGEPLVEPAVAAPKLVAAGDTVQVVLRRAGVELRLRGTATGSAGIGERVLVRVDARRRMEGTVVGPALVLLQSPERSR